MVEFTEGMLVDTNSNDKEETSDDDNKETYDRKWEKMELVLFYIWYVKGEWLK